MQNEFAIRRDGDQLGIAGLGNFVDGEVLKRNRLAAKNIRVEAIRGPATSRSAITLAMPTPNLFCRAAATTAELLLSAG
jgi:hypothetical protein